MSILAMHLIGRCRLGRGGGECVQCGIYIHQFNHILVASDFNYSDNNWDSWCTEKDSSELFLRCIKDCFWFQYAHDFTRYTLNQQPSVLDLIITNEDDMVLGLELLPL